MKKLMILFFFLFTINNLKAKTIYVSKNHNLTQLQQAIVLTDLQTLEKLKDKSQINLANFLSNLFRCHTTPLRGNCLKRVLKLLQAMIDAGADVNAKTSNFYTALHFACQNGHKEVVELLIKAGADVNAKTSFSPPSSPSSSSSYYWYRSYTALHFACQNGHKEVVELLIKAGADLNAKTSNFYTALHLACQNGEKELAELLCFYGAEIIDSCKKEMKEAMQIGFKRFIAKQLNEFFYTKEGLQKAIKDCNIVEIKIILKNGVSVNTIFESGETALHIAIRRKAFLLVKFLIENGADVNLKNKEGQTPLELCYQIGEKEDVTLLLIAKTLLGYMVPTNMKGI